MNTKEYPLEPDFDTEYEMILNSATDYEPGKVNDFRGNISKLVGRTVDGKRSVEGFVKVCSALSKDETGALAKNNIILEAIIVSSFRMREYDIEYETENGIDTAKTKHLTLTKMVMGLLEEKVIERHLCLVNLTSQLLFDAKMIPSKTIFDRKLVRMNTARLYKQNKFNLIQEENEGYASLLNDLTTSSIDNDVDSNGKLLPTPMSRIPDFLNIFQSRMGVFHIDPNRALDIILDLLISQLQVNYKFWVELLKQSAWIEKHIKQDASGETTTPSAIMAQLIGFRFLNFHEQNVVPPKELFLVAAILLKNNIILLGDIIPHLYPYPDIFKKLQEDYHTKMNKEIKSNSGGKLAMYGALGEEGGTEKAKRTNPANDEKSNEEDSKKYPGNDVVALIKALLAVGDIKNAQLMWAGCDKVIELFPELVYDIYRICNIILQPACEKFISAKNQAMYKQFNEESYKSRMKSALITGDDFNPKIPSEFKLKRVLVMDALLDEVQDLNKKERYVFFYKEWDEQLPFCHAPEDIESKFMPIMRLAGYKTYLATELVQKLVLIASGLLEREKEYPTSRELCKNIIREFLLPAISFSEGNPGTMASVWEILCRFSFQERYEIYDEWYNDFYKDDIETKLLKARTERSVKYVMRRVSKNDIRRCGRDLGKLAHSNPTIVFNVVLDQVQNFDNMAPLMADACRYLGDFSYDVLGYVLTGKWTGSLGRNMSKPKEKDDGMPSNWLRSLAVFSGMLYKKQDIDSTPLLRYLAFRLHSDDSVADLILLNEFVTKMGGVEILASACTDSQITAAGCADSLKTEAFLPISPDNRRASRRVLNRLKESLRRNNIGFEILILLYRLHEVCASERGVPVSDRCQKLDKVHQTRNQYFELLCSLFEGDEYAALVPNVDVLVKNYRLPLEVAMDFNRPKTQFKIAQSMDVLVTNGEIWPPIQELIEVVSTVLPDPPTPSMFTAEFYTLFWQLSLYDIHCPVEHYEAAISRHSEMIRQCQDPRSSYCQANRDSVVRKSERQAQASLDALREDLPKHKAHVEKVMAVLQDSCTRWFPSSMHRTDLINNILQHCILPRGRQSEVDAVYCFEFALLMHKLNTKNLSSLTLFDKLLSEHMPAILICFTEYETTIQSRFLFRTLSKMATWRKDKDFYYEQSHGKDLIGFQKNWSSQPTAEVSKEDLLSYNDFLRVLVKWHNKIYMALEQAMKSDEPHLIKNAFLVLRQFLPCFPATVEHGDNIAAIVKKLSDEENARPNLKVLARSYNGLISKSKTKWVSKNKFLGIKDPAPAPPLEIKIAPSTASSVGASKNEESSNRRREEESSSSTSRANTARDESTNKKRDDQSSKSTTDRDDSSSKRRDDHDSRRDDRDSRRDDRDSRRDDRDSRRDDRDSRRDDRDSRRDDHNRRDDRDKRDDRNIDSKKRDAESSKYTSSSRQTSPGKTEIRSQAPSSPTSDRKRSREHESRREGESSRIKSPKLDESSRRRTPSSAPSSSRPSPRDSPSENPSRTSTPYRDSPRRDTARDAIRDAARDSPRSDNSRNGGRLTANSSPLPSNGSSGRSHELPPTSNSSNMRSSRISTTSETSRHDSSDRHLDSTNKGTKRNLDEGRDRDDRPDKRRDIRPDRLRDDRPRIEDRLRIDSRPRIEDRLRVDDRRDDRQPHRDRRMDDRRPDNRRDRDVRDHRSSRRR